MAFPASPYQQTGGLVYFARMISKIRLFAAGELPPEYHANRGDRADAVLCDYLDVRYADLERAVVEGSLDAEQALAWCYEQRSQPLSGPRIKVWNDFLSKRGWRDDRTASLQQEIAAAGLEGRGIETVFELMVAEEGHAR
ncbi:MAG: DUF5069 domain-containing protein [Verrucomicrobiota bacterium JB022]|nr:DUF5069 domain-containing protein [Verrucomicrobiota bacterium JB022]